jgi:hypothetical protein
LECKKESNASLSVLSVLGKKLNFCQKSNLVSFPRREVRCEMKNRILWTIGGPTVDYPLPFRREDEYYKKIEELEKENILPEFNPVFQRICKYGQSRDIELRLSGAEAPDKIHELIGHLGIRESQQMGGSPAISAVKGFYLDPNGLTGLPKVIYVGLCPKSVEDFITERDDYAPIFIESGRMRKEESRPATVSLEPPLPVKLMISHREGRNPDDLLPDGKLDPFLNVLEKNIDPSSGCTNVFALGGISGRKSRTSPELEDLERRETRDELSRNEREKLYRLRLEEELESLEQMNKLVGRMEEVSQRAIIFVGTRSFEGTGEGKPKIIEAFKRIIKQADIVSFNEAEFSDFYDVCHGPEVGKSLSWKLRDLDLNAVVIVHAPEGSILDLGVNPDALIKSGELQRDPRRFLPETLQLAVDGAALALAYGRNVGLKASWELVNHFSETVEVRQEKEFINRFVLPSVIGTLPPGVVGMAAPRIEHQKGGVTGIGAIFDGLLLSLLMRD